MSEVPRGSRRRLLAGLVAAATAPWSMRRAWAADAEVPVKTQMALLAKVVKYDRNAVARMSGTCRVLIVRADDDTSKRAAAQIRTDLGELEHIAEAPVSLEELVFADAASVAGRCTEASIDILVVAPGLSPDVSAIAEAIDGFDLLSVAIVPRDVLGGAVLGFELESSHPRIVINLPRARAQNVDFSSRLLALAKVVQ